MLVKRRDALGERDGALVTDFFILAEHEFAHARRSEWCDEPHRRWAVDAIALQMQRSQRDPRLERLNEINDAAACAS